ncbi:MAG TPA: hypothetical protein VEU47_08380 [Candidatus Cybelea sp.]|nr:hypothetical protein [Candidatus Cybelea sp.]
MSGGRTETPVVMVIFNRPDLARRVMARVREVEPRRLFVLADGARDHVPADKSRIAETRAVVDLVDWDCKVEADFSDRNLGCSGRIVSGLTKVFDAVEDAIVVEDDILPHPNFFRFCDELLPRYRDEPRVHAVTGAKFPCEPRTKPYSYRFSRMFNCWGWAGWRRAWRNVDTTLSSVPQFISERRIEGLAQSRLESLFYLNGFEQAYARKIEPWDWSVMFTAYVRRELFIVPDRNLVANIGWGPEATQHKDSNHILSDLPTFPMEFPLRHPETLAADAEADLGIYDMIGPLTGPRFVRSIRKRLRRRTRERFLREQAAESAA